MRNLRRSAKIMAKGCVSLGFSVSAGCGNGESRPGPTARPGDPPPPVTPIGGYFAGEVTFPDGAGYAEALVTRDGQVRIHMEDTAPADDPGQVPDRRDIQFVGTVSDIGDEVATGSGIVIGEHCRAGSSSPYCTARVPAEIELSIRDSTQLEGELRVSLPGGEQTWGIGMGWPTDTYVTQPATLQSVQGNYAEKLADFAHEGDVVMTVDDSGRLFFQSVHSGCIGNGRLSPHGDGTLNVFDVELQIENCDATYQPLNGVLQGLATRSVGNLDWGDWLVVWASRERENDSGVALSLWGERL